MPQNLFIRGQCTFRTMTHFPRCSDSGNHIQQKNLPNNSNNILGTLVLTSKFLHLPGGHKKTEEEEQHLRARASKWGHSSDHWGMRGSSSQPGSSGQKPA